MKLFIVALELLVILSIVGFIVLIYSGSYNVAASSTDYGIVQWVLETTMEKSVRHHAQGVVMPDLPEVSRQKGVEHFAAMCVLCHGAPGVDPSAIGRGLKPQPPVLGTVVHEWTSAELFWIVGNGIKMTGMPAFGRSHREEELWGIVAFIRQLPEMTAAEYRSLTERPQGEGAPETYRPQGGAGHPH
jgi:mono/diheme cytochrome c family protein